MSELVESGSGLAWRVLAALEGGALLAGGAALLAHRWRHLAARKTKGRAVHNVLITNPATPLGSKLVKELESRGCRVTSLASEAIANEANETNASGASEQVDALVVIGATPKAQGLEGLSELVTKDVYDNLKLLESQIGRVRRGGRVVWAACTGDATSESSSGAFRDAYKAFDDVLKTQLEFIAHGAGCEASWVGRRCSTEAVRMISNTLLPSTYSVRNLAVRLRTYAGRWLKIIS